MSFDNVMEVQFGRLRNEFETQKNILEGLFVKKKNMKNESYEDFLDGVMTEFEQSMGTNNGRGLTGSKLGNLATVDLRTTNPDGNDDRGNYDPSTGLRTGGINTPPAQIPKFRRRVNLLYGDNIHLKVPRDVAKFTGKEQAVLAERFIRKGMAAKNRSMFHLTRNMFDATYDERIKINDHPEDVVKIQRPFPAVNALIPRRRTLANGRWTESGTAARVPFLIDDWTHIEAMLDNAVGQSSRGVGGMDNTLDGFQKIAFFSNSGWADFFNTNIDRVGHGDWFGKPLLLKGYGNLYTIRDFLIVTIPDSLWINEFSRTVVTGAATGNTAFNSNFRDFVFKKHVNTALEDGFMRGGPKRPLPVTSTDAAPLTAAGIAENTRANTRTGTASNQTALGGLHHAFIMYRSAFELADPVQLQLTPRTYEDYNQRFQKRWFCEWALEGRRDYDNVMFRVFFNSGTDIVTT